MELRKRIPNLGEGDELLIYASAPVMAIVGAVEVSRVIKDAPDHLWTMVKDHAAVEQEFFDQYYQDHLTAYGIFLGHAQLYQKSCALQRLRVAWPGFVPPQNYRYVQVWNAPQHRLTEATTIFPTSRAGRFGLHTRD
ncbi:hypothetical protein DESA109040_23060 [Deinococcus saxicola]